MCSHLNITLISLRSGSHAFPIAEDAKQKIALRIKSQHEINISDFQNSPLDLEMLLPSHKQ